MQRIPNFHPSRRKGPIIVTMGLPCTRKSFVARKIGKWAKCPVLYIDDFIEDEDDPIAAGSWEEAELLQAKVLQRSFTTLCRVARRLSSTRDFPAVVIKSRLSSTFELQQLMDIIGGYSSVLIVECRVRNKHQWRHQFNAQDDDYQYLYYERTWYRPRSWNDIEKAIHDHFRSQARDDWDRHLVPLKNWNPPRLVVDPFYDLDLSEPNTDLNPVFCHAINYLLSEDLNFQNPNVMEFDEFRRSRAEQILKAFPSSSTRSKHVCGAQSGGCLFKYWQQLPTLAITASSLCGVCGEGLVIGDPAYTCYYCILALHKSCAEMIHFNFLNICQHLTTFFDEYIRKSEKKVPCKACTDKGSAFNEGCPSCLFQTLLKGRLVPLVVNHDHHPHPLSLRIQRKIFVCKACGTGDWDSSYVCSICEWNYHSQCVFMPREVEHDGHGGHDHVLKLKYKQDDMEEEDYWCDVCYQDLDPYFWFYSCQSCPSYAAHLYCARVYPRPLWYVCEADGM